MKFDSTWSATAREEAIENLQEKVLDAYRDLSGCVETTKGLNDPGEGADIQAEIRYLCGRLESILGLLTDEQEDPELDLDEIEAGACNALGEVDSLQLRVKQLVERLRGKER